MKSDERIEPLSRFRVRLTTIIFGWFMILSLAPLATFGILEYVDGKKIIIKNNDLELSKINLLLSSQLKDFFDSIVNHVFIRSWHGQEFIQEIIDSNEYRDYTVKKYVESREYKAIVEKHAHNFTGFIKSFGYENILVGDAKGNILYSTNENEYIGENVFVGFFFDSALSKSIKKSLTSYKPTYTLINGRESNKEKPSGYFSLPLIGENDKLSGFIVVKTSVDHVKNLFSKKAAMLGGNVNSYLVSEEGSIIAGTSYRPELNLVLNADNPLFTLWKSHVNDTRSFYEKSFEHHALTDNSIDTRGYQIRSYNNLLNKEVLGIYYPVEVGATHMAMISEVTRDDAFAPIYQFQQRLLLVIGIIFIIVIVLGMFITKNLVKPIRTIASWLKRVSSGDYVEGEILKGSVEITDLSKNFIEMTEKLRLVSRENNNQLWMQAGMAGLNDTLQGDRSISDLAQNIIIYLCRYLDFPMGAMYILKEDQRLHLMGSYGMNTSKQHFTEISIGDGLVGQAALEKKAIEITNVPTDYAFIESGLGCAAPHNILIIPIMDEDELKGVFEFALLQTISKRQSEILDESISNVAIAVNSAIYRDRVKQLLDETTNQSHELKEQQEELQAVNEALEERANILEESEEELKSQSDELQKTNAELEEKGEQLLQQKHQIEKKNDDIEASKKAVEEKAKELEQSSKYKSEFLANMSHELRTPLNSLLLLSQMLADNDKGNLTEDQVESAQVIYTGGNELLAIINDILDLSKVEAGKMSVNLEYVDIVELCDKLTKTFKPLADSKGVDYKVSVDQRTTQLILSDSQRLHQIIKNFLSNAFKFTESGEVSVNIFPVVRKERASENSYVVFAVKDSGIGIPKEKLSVVFQAFQQADGSTSRKYGGTGLGLAISKEFANLLGGIIEVESIENEGTTFSLLLPDNPVLSLNNEKLYADSYLPGAVDGSIAQQNVNVSLKTVENSSAHILEPELLDVQDINSDLPYMLLIDDDSHCLSIIDVIAKNNRFQCVHATTGKQGIELAKKLMPQAIILDLGLSDGDGDEVLKELSSNKRTKDIPIHIITVQARQNIDGDWSDGYLQKPFKISDLEKYFINIESDINSGSNNVLVLDKDPVARSLIVDALAQKSISVTEAGSLIEVENLLMKDTWQCLVIDCDFDNVACETFLNKMQDSLGNNMPFVIIQTAKELNEKEYRDLHKYTSLLIMKGDLALSRVKDEVQLFMHSLKEEDVDVVLKNENKLSLEKHKVLLVDDDPRNIFSLSKGLQKMGLEVVIADNGQEALDKLESDKGIELILMDVMMPVMDGYEATRIIRKNEIYKDMPIIALTAKAMPEDRDKCIDAGANDYITKPVSLDKLVSMLKLWLLQ